MKTTKIKTKLFIWFLILIFIIGIYGAFYFLLENKFDMMSLFSAVGSFAGIWAVVTWLDSIEFPNIKKDSS